MAQLDDFLYRLLYLEEQFESYRRLHGEEQEALAKSLAGLRRDMLTMLTSARDRSNGAGVGSWPDRTSVDDLTLGAREALQEPGTQDAVEMLGDAED